MMDSIESPGKMHSYVMDLVKKYGRRIGETVETPDDIYVSSYKFKDSVNVEVQLVGTINHIKIEGTFKL